MLKKGKKAGLQNGWKILTRKLKKGLQPDTPTTPLPMRYASMGYTSMGFYGSRDPDPKVKERHTSWSVRKEVHIKSCVVK